MVANYKLVIARHLLDAAKTVKDHLVARQFVQGSINAMVGPSGPDFREAGKMRNPVQGMVGKGLLSDLQKLKFNRASVSSRSALQAAKRALSEKDLGGLRRYVRLAIRHLDAALRSSVPAVRRCWTK